jgi:lactoylglutathione lyase
VPCGRGGPRTAAARDPGYKSPASAKSSQSADAVSFRGVAVQVACQFAMSRIEHVALWVRDLDSVCDFYARYLGAKVGSRYENPAKGFASRFLVFEAGARIEVMTTTSMSPVELEHGAHRMGLTHLALAVGSESEVDRLTNRLRADGHAVLEGPRRTGDGYYETVVLDPEGNRVDLTAG